MTKEQIALSIVPVLLKSCKDPVPNVRFCVAKLLKKIASKIDPATLNSKVKPTLTEMGSDPDKDVRFFAKQALTSC